MVEEYISRQAIKGKKRKKREKGKEKKSKEEEKLTQREKIDGRGNWLTRKRDLNFETVR